MMWTTKQERHLALLINDGLSNTQIADQMGREYRSITAKINELGLSRRKNTSWTKKRLAEVYALYDRGFTTKRIAEEVNSTFGQIRNILYDARKRGLIGYRNNVGPVPGVIPQD